MSTTNQPTADRAENNVSAAAMSPKPLDAGHRPGNSTYPYNPIIRRTVYGLLGLSMLLSLAGYVRISRSIVQGSGESPVRPAVVTDFQEEQFQDLPARGASGSNEAERSWTLR